MIYLVSNQTQLFDNDYYKVISVEESLSMMSNWEILQFDSETSGRDPHICKILCIQFGNKKANCQIVVDTTTIDISIYKELLESKLLLGQNLKFDLQFLYTKNIVPLKVYDTMIVEQLLHLGYPSGSISMSLRAIAKRYLNIDIDKTVREEISWRGLDSSVIIYAAGDVIYLEDIATLQKAKCIERNCYDGAILECNFVPVIAYLEWCGIRLDVEKWKIKMQHDEYIRDLYLDSLNKYIINAITNRNPVLTYLSHHGKEEDEILSERAKLLKYAIRKEDADILTDFNAYFEAYEIPIKGEFPSNYISINRQGDLFSGFDPEPKCLINWGSSTQVIPILKQLGFNTKVVDKKTGEDKDSALEKVLKGQKGVCDAFLYIYFNYKEASKVCSTYGQFYIDSINPKTGRIHTIFRQLGASSGRMSCGASKMKNTDLMHFKKMTKGKCGYPQLQNLPSDEETRSAFIPNDGNLMCSSDYSALESRLGADIYEEKAMVEEYLHGSGDMHSLVAKACFPDELEGIEIKQIKKVRPDLRQKAKAPEFACQFGGGAMSIKDSLSCSMEEAEAIEKGYYDMFEGIKTFKEKGAKFVKNNGYVLICKYTGHKIYWHDWESWINRGKTFTSEFWDMYRGVKQNYLQQIKAWEDNNKKGPKPSKPSLLEEVSMHFKAGSKWERMALNSPTQGEPLPCINSLNSVKAVMLILS